MKKLAGGILVLVIILLCAAALADVEINETNFPDPNFREELSWERYDANQDGILSDEEIAATTFMNVSSSSISSLKGIEYFPSLQELICGMNQLTSLDLSRNTSLTELECYSNRLKGLDLSNNIALTKVMCSDNQLTSLDVSRNTALKRLECDHNQMKSLNLSGAAALKELFCQNNQLASLDLSKTPALSRLECHFNNLKSLDVSKCKALDDLVRNNGTEIDLYYNTKFWGLQGGEGSYLHVDAPVEVITGKKQPSEPVPEPGETITVNGLKYKVTSDVRLTPDFTVSFAGLAKAKSKSAVTIPATVSYAGLTFKVTEIADKALYKDTKVTKVTVGKNVKTIGKNAFAGCVKLKAVKGGEAVTAIKDSAFSGCKALSSFPVLSKLQTIGASAFKGCVKLAKFTLGEAVKAIGKNAYSGCSGLKEITVKTTKLTAGNVGAGAFKNIHKKAKFKCPAQKKKAYKTLFVKKGAPKKSSFK